MLLLQVSRFYIIGLINTVIDFGIFNLLLACCHEPGTAELLAINTLAVSLAMINSYVLNGRWTFNQLSLHPHQISRFTCASLMGMIINSLIVWAGSCVFSHHIILWLNLSKAAGAVVSSTWNFLAPINTGFFRPPVPEQPVIAPAVTLLAGKFLFHLTCLSPYRAGG